MSRQRCGKLFLLLALMSMVLTACWDKTEMNELALVSMLGLDSDPESGKKIVYFQIINPLSGTSSRGVQGGEQAPVYTYEVSGSSYGEIMTNIYKILPRKLFIAHYKVLIVSERAAREGIRDIVNFIEMQANGRTSVPMLIADGPVAQIMKSFTVLERMPSDAVDSGLKMLNKHSLFVGKRIKVSDLIEHMQQSDITVLPMIRKKSGESSPTSSRTSEDIVANRNTFAIGGGAVFQDYRLVGRLDEEQLIWYYLLDGDRGRHVLVFPIDGRRVSMHMSLQDIKRTVRRHLGRPVVEIHLELVLSTDDTGEYVPQTRSEIKRFEGKIAHHVKMELNAFYEAMKGKGWNLPRIRKTLSRYGASADTASAEVMFTVNARLLHTGILHNLY